MGRKRILHNCLKKWNLYFSLTQFEDYFKFFYLQIHLYSFPLPYVANFCHKLKRIYQVSFVSTNFNSYFILFIISLPPPKPPPRMVIHCSLVQNMFGNFNNLRFLVSLSGTCIEGCLLEIVPHVTNAFGSMKN